MGKAKGGTGGGGPKGAKSRPTQRPKAVVVAKTAEPRAQSTAHQQRVIDFNQMQRLLDVFSCTFAATIASPGLEAALQALKQSLFARDFAAAFGAGDSAEGDSAELALDALDTTVAPLDAYAARWSPPRALCYASVLGSPLVHEHWNASYRMGDSTPLRMVAIGGGAAEVVAFANLLADGEPAKHRRGSLVLVDAAPWSRVVGQLQTAMTDGVSSGRTTVPALVAPTERLAVEVQQRDILQADDDEMARLLGDSTTTTTTTLVSLFFTLNELFTAGGLGAAATFLLRLTKASPPGTVLLVVDSPGSYAEMAVGAQQRRYPMKWLLDKFLVGDGGDWAKVHEDDAIWFRLSPALAYPIRLEDMRYQIHLYVRSKPVDEEDEKKQ